MLVTSEQKEEEKIPTNPDRAVGSNALTIDASNRLRNTSFCGELIDDVAPMDEHTGLRTSA